LEYGVFVLPKRKTPPCAQFAREKETVEIKRRRRGTTDTPNNASNGGCVKIVQKPNFLKHDRKWSQRSRVSPWVKLKPNLYTNYYPPE
jgi:hypothetical protein